MRALSLTAKIIASLTGTLRGREPGLLVIGVLLVVIYGFSLHYGNTLGARVGLGGIVLILIVWLFDRRFALPLTVPVNAIVKGSSGGEVSVRTEVDPSRLLDFIAAIREEAHNVQPFPDPYGKVGDNPVDEKALQALTEAERKEIGERHRKAAKEHSRKIAEEAVRIQRTLMPPVEVPKPEIRSVPPRESLPPKDQK
jgi:hypothetical protein